MQVLLHPRVVECVHQSHPILWLFDEQLSDEVFHFLGQVARELEVHCQDLLVCLLPAFCGLEGSMARTELVAEHSHTPHVHRFVILVAKHDLRRDVIQSPAEGTPLRTK